MNEPLIVSQDEYWNLLEDYGTNVAFIPRLGAITYYRGRRVLTKGMTRQCDSCFGVTTIEDSANCSWCGKPLLVSWREYALGQ